jgi:hypothetical protein
MNLLANFEYSEVEGKRMAVDILEEIANELAKEAEELSALSNRGKIAMHREIKRLRAIANSLKP